MLRQFKLRYRRNVGTSVFFIAIRFFFTKIINKKFASNASFIGITISGRFLSLDGGGKKG